MFYSENSMVVNFSVNNLYNKCKAERGRLTPYQSEYPSPTLKTYRGKEENGKIVEDKKRREQLGKQKGIGPALETRQSNTIKYGVNQIIPERY